MDRNFGGSTLSIDLSRTTGQLFTQRGTTSYRSRYLAPLLFLAADGITIAAAALLAIALRGVIPETADVYQQIQYLWPFGVVLWLVMLSLSGGYADKNLGAGTREYNMVLWSSLATASAIAIASFLAKFDLSRGFFLLFFLVGTPMLLLERFVVRRVIHQMRVRQVISRRVLLAGDVGHVNDVLKVITREAWLGYHVVGALVPSGADASDLPLKVLGTPHDAVEIVHDRHIDQVIFTEGAFPDAVGLRKLAWDLEGERAQMAVVPALTDISAQRVQVRPVAGLPLVIVESPTAQRAGRWAKRAFDIVGASAALILAAPVMLFTMLAIKFEDRGPALFKQVRVGKGGQEFECLKFRSMVVDAEARLVELNNQGPNEVMFKIARDPRITGVGNTIRRFSIDELPQLWNVLRGDMSLIGPRPALPKEVAQYAPHVNRRLEVRPGLTGLWQVSGRSNLSWEDTVRLDLYYVDNWSMAQDLAILCRTVGAVMFSNGAY